MSQRRQPVAQRALVSLVPLRGGIRQREREQQRCVLGRRRGRDGLGAIAGAGIQHDRQRDEHPYGTAARSERRFGRHGELDAAAMRRRGPRSIPALVRAAQPTASCARSGRVSNDSSRL
ncbi:hypothetical protein [Lysobacter gummosus]|uniref:hypothetical protein n=1 Tax=Lysobacter gummosus TaxID=262324 RepID=UPI0036444670